MEKALLLELKRSIRDIKNFHGNQDLLLEEDAIERPLFHLKGEVKSVIDENSVDVSSFSKTFDSVYFIDGIQRTILLGEVNANPVYAHFSGAAVMRRKNKKILPFGEPELQVSFITNSEVELDSKIPVERITPENPQSYHARSSLLRKQLERSVLRNALKIVGSSEAIIYDGPLHYSEALTSGAIVLGVIKRHAMLYLPSRRPLYELGQGWRTGAFRTERGREQTLFSMASFYQRLFSKKGPYYGVVRVEIPAGLVKSADDVNDFAGFIHSERFPISFSTHQSDKKLYPISVCEKFLASKMPSLNLISAFLRDVLQ